MPPALVDDELWELIQPLLPRKTRRYRHPGRRGIDDRKVLNVILFVLTTGIAWQSTGTSSSKVALMPKFPGSRAPLIGPRTAAPSIRTSLSPTTVLRTRSSRRARTPCALEASASARSARSSRSPLARSRSRARARRGHRSPVPRCSSGSPGRQRCPGSTRCQMRRLERTGSAGGASPQPRTRSRGARAASLAGRGSRSGR